MLRPYYMKAIRKQLRVHPICGLLGPRQVGKTYLAELYRKRYADRVSSFDLEKPIDLARLENPYLALAKLTSELIIIDEIQRRPELFPVLRVLVDEGPKKRKFLVLGSASRDLIRQSSETLAGRIGYVELTPLSLDEAPKARDLLVRGGFPRSYLAKSDQESYIWRQAYIRTFLERDLPGLGIQIPPNQIRRFWMMLAHYHGQIFNASEIGRSLGISDHTARKYLDLLVGTFMVRLLPPWFENLSKRQVKSPKIYFRDSGILLGLVGVHNEVELDVHPRQGAFWEGYALEEVTRHLMVAPEDCFFWAAQGGAELDLLVMKDGKRFGFEFKYADEPRITSSMRIAFQDLHLNHLYVVHPGKSVFSMDEHITALGLQGLSKSLA